MIRRLHFHLYLCYLRFRVRRHGLPTFTDAGYLLGVLAAERMRWTREDYWTAMRAELPKVRASGLVGRRDVERAVRWLDAEHPGRIP